MSGRYLVGDVFDGLATLPDGSVDLVVTSPPFLALRSYLPADHPDKGKEIGSEATPAEFIDVMLRVTAELRRVLAPHGSICVELGDTYAGSGGGGGDYLPGGWREGQQQFAGSEASMRESNAAHWRQKNEWKKGGLANYNDDRGNPDGMRDPTFSGANTLTGSGQGWPLAKSKALIAELYRVALAYGINPLTGQESPAGRWRVRNVVTWVRPNPPVGALGDKWRPATSDLVVACTSAKRYWDDLATRKPVQHPLKSATTAFDENGDRRRKLNPYDSETQSANGAPLLDWWEIPPGGYKGSHYAVYPEELVIPCIQAMCPPKVCRTCGEPSRRIVGEPTYVKNGQEVPRNEWGSGIAEGLGAHSHKPDGQTTRVDQTLGWSDCGHGSIVCSSCSALVPYDYAAIRRSRETAPIQGRVGQEEVLGKPGEGTSGQAKAPASVRGLRGGLPGADGRLSSVQPILFGEARTHGGPSEPDSTANWTGEPDVEGWSQDQPSGLRPDMGAPGLSGTSEERLHDGASSGDAGSPRAAAGNVGVGSSQERDQGRQPDRKPGDREPREASGSRDLPELRDGVSTPLDGYVCACGSTDFKYVADHWRPGLILDPFAGSGTTLAVATGYGHDAIGIDLDPRNAELALERVGPFLLEVLDIAAADR